MMCIEGRATLRQKQRFHFENAAKQKLGQGNHMIIVRSRLRNVPSSLSQKPEAGDIHIICIAMQSSVCYSLVYQGHPTDRFFKLSQFSEAFNPLQFS